MDYRNKTVLAPMVRVGTLPFRLLAAEYGADITYGEEIVDHKIWCKDVAAVDINMGCPKSFSTSGGMGAALLSKPELIHDRNLDTAVTCKIRLLRSSQDTVELARRIEKMGVPALAVHGRPWAYISFPHRFLTEVWVPDREEYLLVHLKLFLFKEFQIGQDPAKWSEIADVVAALSIPVIANGDVFEYEDIHRIKKVTGMCASSVMIARGALWNASIFSPNGKVPWEEVKIEYVRKSILWDNDVKSAKHTLKEMIMHYSSLELPEGKAVIKSDTLADLGKLYGEDSYYKFVTSSRFSNGRRGLLLQSRELDPFSR
ncbi:tRNA-dihydrouridine(20) synthase (NAD(P)(+)) [Bertholletia excelsa]